MHFAEKAKYSSDIQRMAYGMQDGDEAREICPACGGGSNKERSLSIRCKGYHANYICWRGTCDLGHGRVSLMGDDNGVWSGRSHADTARAQRGKAPSPLQTYSLTNIEADFLKRQFGLTDDLILYGGVGRTTDFRLAYPIFNKNRSRIGHVVRKYKSLYKGSYDYVTVPKSINVIPDKKHVPLSWYYKGRGVRKQTDTLVLVEDQVSALCLVPYIDSCALLGASITVKRQIEIRSQRYATIILALDEDATKVAARILKKEKLNIPNLKVKFLSKDIKDMDAEERQEFVSNCHQLEDTHD